MNEHGEPIIRRNAADDCLMTLEEVGAYLQVRVGRYVRYRRAEVDRWLETCEDPERRVEAGVRWAS
jgi:hypothetical protein